MISRNRFLNAAADLNPTFSATLSIGRSSSSSGRLAWTRLSISHRPGLRPVTARNRLLNCLTDRCASRAITSTLDGTDSSPRVLLISETTGSSPVDEWTGRSMNWAWPPSR